ncbi:MAG: DpnII family type II restriction endonuclease [Candidatus Saccharibacteria bacterium]
MFNTEYFLKSLVGTNKSHEFFTNWQKARNNQNEYRDELALLAVMTNCGEPKEELTRLLTSYPRINSLLPLLNAVRIKNPKETLLVLDESSADDLEYYFGTKDINKFSIEKSVSFAEKSGLLAELVSIKNHSDYYFGVEVGLDSNARKNRSGTAMEDMAEVYIKDFVNKHNGRYLTQTNFSKASKEFGVEMPIQQANKKGDFMLLIDGKPINIETNYFDGSGSKQEIMNSYISRAEDLAKAGWGFGLITDGLGWKKNKNQVDHGYARIGNVMNLSMCKNGALDEMYGYLIK